MNYGLIEVFRQEFVDSVGKEHILSEMQYKILRKASKEIFDGRVHSLIANISCVKDGRNLVVRMELDVS